MIVAKLFRGPFDGEIMSLPEAIPICVIPDFNGLLVVSYVYLLADELDDYWPYLYEEDISPVTM